MVRKKQIEQLDDSPIPLPEGISDVKEENENTVAEGLKEVKVRYPGKWIKMTPEQVVEYSEGGTLFGYDPETGEGLLKEDR